MELETGTIKGKKTSYTKTDGSKVVKYSKTINLGVNSAFDCGINVVVMAETDYNNLMNSNSIDIKASETIEQLNNTIDEKETTINNLTSKVAELTDEIRTIGNTNRNNLETITQLTASSKAIELELTEIKAIMKQYNINGADELNTLIIEFRIILNYLTDCLTAYQQQGRFNGFLKRNPTTDIGKPTTKLIDYRGNKFANNSDEVKANKVDNSQL